jgi:hypothetical protein
MCNEASATLARSEVLEEMMMMMMMTTAVLWDMAL